MRAGRAVPAALRRRGVLAGVRQVFADSLLASIVVVALVAHVTLAALFASLPALAFRDFHDARSAGVLFGADAVGSVIGGLPGGAISGYAIARAGFHATYAAVAAAMTLATLLLSWCGRRSASAVAALPAVSPAS